MKTLVTIYHYEGDSPPVVGQYESEGEWQVQTQFTSWMRECAVDYWQKIKEKSE